MDGHENSHNPLMVEREETPLPQSSAIRQPPTHPCLIRLHKPLSRAF